MLQLLQLHTVAQLPHHLHPQTRLEEHCHGLVNTSDTRTTHTIVQRLKRYLCLRLQGIHPVDTVRDCDYTSHGPMNMSQSSDHHDILLLQNIPTQQASKVIRALCFAIIFGLIIICIAKATVHLNGLNQQLPTLIFFITEMYISDAY